MKQQGYIKSLDGTRALSIILVMAFHAGLIEFAWVSVQLFFVLSGFLITGILWKEKFRTYSLANKFKTFLARRSLRIFPLYFAYLIGLGFIYFLFHFPSYYAQFAPYLFTYTINYTRLMPGWLVNPLFTHLWTLSIEEQFYLFFPFVILLMSPRWIKYLLIFFILASPVIRWFVGAYYLNRAEPVVALDAVYWNTLTHLDAFFMGAIIPVLSLDSKIRKPEWVFFIVVGITLGAGLVNHLSSNSSVQYISSLGYTHDQTDNYTYVWRYSLLNLFFASLIFALTSEKTKHFSWTRKFFEQPWLVRVGRVSYGMYIFHWAVLIYVFQKWFHIENKLVMGLLFIPYVLIVYLLAEFSYRKFESRFLVLKDKLFPVKNTLSAKQADQKAAL